MHSRSFGQTYVFGVRYIIGGQGFFHGGTLVKWFLGWYIYIYSRNVGAAASFNSTIGEYRGLFKVVFSMEVGPRFCGIFKGEVFCQGVSDPILFVKWYVFGLYPYSVTGGSICGAQ